MAEILKNVELRGSTMGSFKEFEQAIAFIDKHKLRPVVYKTVQGLDKADEVLSIMKNGDQFGRLAIRIAAPDASSKL
jgi:D-arabinose 1-dehydrogenase-like Zn-dependent alcohol dehydrogenase